MANERTEHSRMGMASFVVALLPGLPIALVALPALLLASSQPPGADETGFAVLFILLALMNLLSEIVALGFGIAGTLQRRRKRLFAFLGVACSILVLVMINAEAGFADVASLIAGMTETQPKVVSPGNE
ncbi:MAG: hypothetical protein ACRDSJ_21840 [Rubrobacteraceae bacterium]